jgi:outer membrane immunogenic protein
MKKLLLTTTVAMLAAPAIAADLPSRAAPPPPAPIAAPSAARTVTVLPTFTWSGFYAGVQGGYAFGAGDGQLTETTSAATPVISSFDRSIKPRGFLGGLHAGYNFQSGGYVYGLEADAEYAMVDGSLSSATSTNATTVGRFSAEQDFRGSLRARFGLAYDGILIYVTGGAAAARIEATYAAAGRASKNDVLIGWTAGAGVEYALWSNWSVRAEYRYTNFGDQSVSFPGTTVVAGNTSSYKWSVDHTEHAVRAGLTYRFGGESSGARPIFARY